MVTNKKLKAALLQHLGVTCQRLSQRVKKVRDDYGPMPTHDAVYVIAHQESLNLTKYLPAAAVDRVRSIVQGGNSSGKSVPVGPRSGKRRTSLPRPVNINITGVAQKVDALLSSTLAQDAQAMARLYPIYYVLENSLREVIKRVLEDKHGAQWWNGRVSKEVKDKVSDRKNKEAKQPWHGKRGQHEIFYTSFRDLRSIIELNWSDFDSIFPSRPWITQRLDELEHPRNVLAHHNPVNKTDQKRVELYFEDWMKQLDSVRDRIT